ncbi:hypothetical protein MdSGHV007 [Musca domestica salivary gland hypertrophy virus]|uniref:Uncharacterized protein n=1 Tax=Musca hytrovirus(isolate Musca domestica/United States/Boucias/-) TaxID=523909 RepID=B2YFY4_MHVB|nr:hypothetical protein MdSGHV007 [Musca domestica salivary gland hypertrophy virus]ACD03466.1 hypothetical protein MdSGHV007 [Musca domestica salivary gland hypertrophy virus]
MRPTSHSSPYNRCDTQTCIFLMGPQSVPTSHNRCDTQTHAFLTAMPALNHLST